MDIMSQVEKIWWWHKIDLKNGIVTPGKVDPSTQLFKIQIPEDLTGKTVLDIGAWDGYFSFLAEERGADVTATDDFNYSWGRIFTGKAGFDLAKRVRKSNVKEYVSSVYSLNPNVLGCFDIVFFLGVLYHLKSPYQALEIVYSLTREMAIIETVTSLNDIEKPIMEFYHNRACEPSNWFAPNLLCLIDMLKTVGFSEVLPTLDYPKVAVDQRVAVHAIK